MSRKFINPPGLKPLGMYTQVTVAQGGADDIQAQAVQVFENLKLALGGIDATFENVIKFTIYIVGLTQETRKAVMDVRGRYISHDNPPAATMVGVDQLVEPEFLVEVEAVVAID